MTARAIALFVFAAACAEEETTLFVEYPPLDGAPGALIAVIAPQGIDVYAHDPDDPRPIKARAGDATLEAQAAILSSSPSELGVDRGRLTPIPGAPQRVLDLHPLKLARAIFADGGTPAWTVLDALDPRFATFGMPRAPSDCFTFTAVDTAELDGYPRFVVKIDELSFILGAGGGLVRVDASGEYVLPTPPNVIFFSGWRDDAGRVWFGGNEGDLWSGELYGASLDLHHVATSTGSGPIFWMSGSDSRSIMALTYSGWILRFDGTTFERVGPRFLAESIREERRPYGGVASIDANEAIIVHAASRDAIVFKDGQAKTEALPIRETDLGDPGWGGTVLVRDGANRRTLGGSAGQVFQRDDSTKTWTMIGFYDSADPWQATSLLPSAGGHYAGDGSGRLWQYSEVRGAYCPSTFKAPAALMHLVELDGVLISVGLSVTTGEKTQLTWLSRER